MMVATTPVPIDQRFALLIKQFGLTKNSFAISLGKTASVVQHLIDGRNKPGYDLLCKVFEIYPNVSRDWLLLGRGPMLVGGEPVLKAPVAPKPATPEVPLEPIDLSNVEVNTSRRQSSGGAGIRLQPAEIAATLALAAAANQPARAALPLPDDIPAVAPPPALPASFTYPVASPAPVLTTPVAAVPQSNEQTPLIAPAAVPLGPAIPAVGTTASPEAFVTAALHAQHLQHQLSMAELRNQHLLEQQQMLREMLAMARQAAG